MFHVQLIDDFRSKYFKFWSVRLQLIASIAGALEVANTFGMIFLPSMEAYIPQGTFAVVSFVFLLAGLVARGIKQVWPEIDTLPTMPPDQVKGEGAWPESWTVSGPAKEVDIKDAYPGVQSDDKAAY